MLVSLGPRGVNGELIGLYKRLLVYYILYPGIVYIR